MPAAKPARRFRDSVAKHGFGLIPNLFTEQEIDRVLQAIVAAPASRTRAGIRHFLKFPAVADFAKDARLLRIARLILGDGALPFRATLFDKSARANWLVAWHQDTALPLQKRQEVPGWGPWSVKDGVTYAHAPATVLSGVLALRVHLDDSTEENGPLRVLPGTHTLGVLDDDTIASLAGATDGIACLTARGGAVAMRPLLLHASSKSRNAAARRVLHIEYAAIREVAEGLQLTIA